MEQLELFTNLSLNNVFEEIIDVWTLKEAFKEVRKNKGSPGADGQTIEEFGDKIEEEVRKLSEELKNWKYKPKPVKRVEIPKPDGGVRKLGIPSVRDRVVQQAIKIRIEWKFEQSFSESSYGFRPNKDQKQAIAKAEEYVKNGREWIVDIDLEKFFDKIPQDRLITRLSNAIEDKRAVKLIIIMLKGEVILPNGIIEATTEGTPQGGPLSPLLSNIVLDELDKELEKRKLTFCRFADDCNIFCGSEKAANRVMESIRKFIENKLKLKVNKDKSKVAKSNKVKFLGISVVRGAVAIAKKSIKRAMLKIKTMIPRNSHKTVEQVIKEVNKWFQGWFEYFKITAWPAQIVKIEAHIRRRLRAKIIAQQKRRKNLVRLLLKRNVSKSLVYKAVYKNRSTWALSHTIAVERAFSNEDFNKLGFKTFSRIRLQHWKGLDEWVKLS